MNIGLFPVSTLDQGTDSDSGVAPPALGCGCPLPKSHWTFLETPIFLTPIHTQISESEAVYTAQVFAPNKTLLLQMGLPFTRHRRAGAYETANVWNRVPGCNLLKPQLPLWLCKLASGVPVNAVTKLMLMPTQVNALCSSHYQTLIKHSAVHQKQVEHEDSLWRWI